MNTGYLRSVFRMLKPSFIVQTTGRPMSRCNEGLRARPVAVKAKRDIPRTRAKMAGNGETNGDRIAHRDSYDRFIWWLKTGTVGTVLVVTLVIFLITR
jgi:hypothetical protein